MPEITLERQVTKTLFPGYEARLIHTKSMTLAYVRVAAGAELPEHSHPHEQVVNVLSGEFELTVEGRRHRLEHGIVYAIPPNAKHAGLARTPCEILDVFCPVREDLL